MPLTEPEKTIIATEITGRIGRFIIRKDKQKEDFLLLIKTLECVLDPDPAIPGDTSARELLNDIREYFDPNLGYIRREDLSTAVAYAQSLIMSRIPKLRTIYYSDSARAAYIAEQDKHTADIVASQLKMRERRPPVGEARVDTRPRDEILRDYGRGAIPWGMDEAMARGHAAAVAGTRSALPLYPRASPAAAAPSAPMAAVAAAAGPVGHHPVVGAPLPAHIAGDVNILFLLENRLCRESDIQGLLRQDGDGGRRLLIAARIARDPYIFQQLAVGYIGFLYIHRRATPGLSDMDIINNILDD